MLDFSCFGFATDTNARQGRVIDSLRHITLCRCGTLFSIAHLRLSAVAFLRARSCIADSPDNEAEVRSELSQFLLRHNPTDAKSVIGFLSLPPFLSFLLFFLALSLFSPSLSSTDLWDQPSKTDSGFFTDHECVSSYVTEAEIKREKRGEQVNVELICHSFLDFTYILAGSLTPHILAFVTSFLALQT